jgi:hypothetical protein
VSLVKLDPRHARTLALEAVAALRHAHSYFSGKATVQIAKVAKASPDPELGKAARHALTGALNSGPPFREPPALTSAAARECTPLVGKGARAERPAGTAGNALAQS